MDIPQVSQLDIEAQVNQALARNARRVLFSYPLLCLIISFQSDFLDGRWSVYWLFALFFCLLSAVRFWHCTQCAKHPLVVWRRLFAVLSLLSVLLWTLLVVIVLLDSGLGTIASVWLIVSAGIAAGGASSMSPSRALAMAFISAAVLPIILALLWLNSPEAMAFVFCLLIFWLHVAAMVWQQSAVFRSAITDNLRLTSYAQALERVGRRDSLTQLFNRGYFNQRASNEWKRLARSGQPLSLLMLDIDHFKSINDSYGHLVGDQCLRLTAVLLEQALRRPSDVVARFGGEEFVVLLPETELEGALAVAEGICQVFSQRKDDPLAGDTAGLDAFRELSHIRFTVSIGVATHLPAQGGSIESLLDAADQSMYEAKRLGRNRVYAASAEG